MFSRSSAVTEAAVLDALRVVRDPDLHKDIVTLGFVKGLTIGGGDVAAVQCLDPAALVLKDRERVVRWHTPPALGGRDGSSLGERRARAPRRWKRRPVCW